MHHVFYFFISLAPFAMKYLIPRPFSLPSLIEEDDFRDLFSWQTKVSVPRVDLEETDKELIVRADVPALERKDIAIKVQDHSLIISGSKTEEKEEKKKKYYYKERSSESFHREIWLPKEVVKDKVSAKMKDGVLIVTLPKAEKPTKDVPIDG